MQRQHLRPILRAALIAAAVTTAVIATAGSLGLKTDRARQHTRYQPRLVTLEGVLQQDRLGAWVLDGETPLRQSPEVRWFEERHGSEGSPAAGRTVRLTGQWYGGVFQVRHAVLVSPDRVVQRMMTPPIAPADEESRQRPE